MEKSPCHYDKVHDPHMWKDGLGYVLQCDGVWEHKHFLRMHTLLITTHSDGFEEKSMVFRCESCSGTTGYINLAELYGRMVVSGASQT